MVDPETIYHWYRLDDWITTSGQPTETELADIAALGVRCVINLGLHSHEKALRDEAATVHALGMTYVSTSRSFPYRKVIFTGWRMLVFAGIVPLISALFVASIGIYQLPQLGLRVSVISARS